MRICPGPRAEVAAAEAFLRGQGVTSAEARGDRKACAQLPVTFRDEKALAEALAPKARGGDRAAGDCLVAALLRRRRVADAQRLRPFAVPV